MPVFFYPTAASLSNSWSVWSDWSPFDQTCGKQQRIRKRTCTISIPWENCVGNSTDVEIINLPKCGMCISLFQFYFLYMSICQSKDDIFHS